MSKEPLKLPGAKQDPKPTQSVKKFQTQLDAAMRRVQENFGILHSCPGPHDFRPKPGGRKGEYQCIKCQGTVSGANALFYTHGLAHGAQQERARIGEAKDLKN